MVDGDAELCIAGRGNWSVAHVEALRALRTAPHVHGGRMLHTARLRVSCASPALDVDACILWVHTEGDRNSLKLQKVLSKL